MSLTDVLPADPVIPTTAAAQLAPPGPGERLQRGERIGGGRAPSRHGPRPALSGRARDASARAPARPRRPRRRPRAPRAANSPPSACSPGRPKNRSPGAASRESTTARSGPPARAGDQRPRRRPRRRCGLATARSCRALWARPRTHASDPLEAPQLLPATSRSSNGIFRPPANSCPCSWPLPAMTTVSPGPAAPNASAIAARRSGSTSIRGARRPRGRPARRSPARISAMIASGSSERGLSEVTTQASASSSARSRPSAGASHGRDRRRTPKTAISRPSVSLRAALRTFSSESGVWA